jgi:hypothetical protein
MTNEEKLQDLIKRRREFRYAIGTDPSYAPKTVEGMLQAEAKLTKEIEELQEEMKHDNKR